MTRLIIYLVRLVLIMVGYGVACMAASAFVNLIFLASAGFEADQVAAVTLGAMIFSIPFVALFISYFAFVPAIPVILLGEILGYRSWLFYALGGGLVGVLVIGFFKAVSNPEDNTIAIPAVLLAIVGGGMVAGIAYWAIAGRLAGNWRGEIGAPVES